MNGDGETSISAGPAAAHVVVIGVGGLGCPAAVSLAQGGVGTITLVDPDVVESSNLPRQLLHKKSNIGEPKVESAAATLLERFPGLAIHPRSERFDNENAERIVGAADFVIDATDGIETKLLINDTAVRCGLPFCYAGVVGSGGQVMTVLPGRTPCLRCLFPGIGAGEAFATCSQAGIIGPMAGIFGALQASLGLAHLNGDHAAAGHLVSYDRRSDRWRNLAITGVGRCQLCATAASRLGTSEGEPPKGEPKRWAM